MQVMWTRLYIHLNAVHLLCEHISCYSQIMKVLPERRNPEYNNSLVTFMLRLRRTDTGMMMAASERL